MENACLLIVAAAKEGKRMLKQWDEYDSRLLKAIQQEPGDAGTPDA